MIYTYFVASSTKNRAMAIATVGTFLTVLLLTGPVASFGEGDRKTAKGGPVKITLKDGNNTLTYSAHEGQLEDVLETLREHGDESIKSKMVLDEMEEALDQRNADKEAKAYMDWIQRTTQSGLETAVSNMKAVIEAFNWLGIEPQMEPGGANDDPVDFGKDDGLGDI